MAVLAGAPLLCAQHAGPPVPYASIGSRGPSYAGPGREASFDLPGPTIRIGLLAPVRGPQKADGEAVVTAAKMALQDASKRPLPGGLHLALAVADESVPPWGLLGDEIIHLVVQQKAIAIVTCADGVAAHLSEQIGNKIGFPTLTLSGDDTATEINMPWIFRMGPSDAQQARVIARRIYRARRFKRVLLVTESGHDGRMGGRAFAQAARRLGAPSPVTLAVDPLQPGAAPLLAKLRARAPQAVVLWTRPDIAKGLIRAMKSAGVRAPIYLSQQAAQQGSGLSFSRLETEGARVPSSPGVYTVASTPRKAPSEENFIRRYRSATGAFPSPVAAEAYDAVWLLAKAVRQAGPNRARVRDRVAAMRDFAGVSGTISFDDQGNNRAGVRLVRLQ